MAPNKETACWLIEHAHDVNSLLSWFKEMYPTDGAAVERARDDSAMLAGMLMAFWERMRPHQPAMSEREVLDFLAAVNGIHFPPISCEILPDYLAAEISEGMIQEDDAEPLRRELDDSDGDPEFTRRLAETRPGRMDDKLRGMTAAQAVALVLGARFFYAHRVLKVGETTEYAIDPEEFALKHFFKLL